MAVNKGKNGMLGGVCIPPMHIRAWSQETLYSKNLGGNCSLKQQTSEKQLAQKEMPINFASKRSLSST